MLCRRFDFICGVRRRRVFDPTDWLIPSVFVPSGSFARVHHRGLLVSHPQRMIRVETSSAGLARPVCLRRTAAHRSGFDASMRPASPYGPSIRLHIQDVWFAKVSGRILPVGRALRTNIFYTRVESGFGFRYDRCFSRIQSNHHEEIIYNAPMWGSVAAADPRTCLRASNGYH
jgi:hypothetical protein